MKVIIITGLILFSQIIFAASDGPTNNSGENDLKLTGFRELSWGDPVSQHESKLTLFQKGEGFALYQRKDETLLIGTAKLTNLIYSFNNGKFTGVIFYTKDLSNKTAITALLDQTLSKKRRKPGSNDRYISWIHKQVNAGIKCGNTNICQIFYTTSKKR